MRVDLSSYFGSLGPSGKMLLTEEVTADALREAFAEQAAELAIGGVDAIVCETFFDLEELTTAVRAATQATGLPLVEAGANIIGACCGSTPNFTRAIVAAVHDETGATASTPEDSQ